MELGRRVQECEWPKLKKRKEMKSDRDGESTERSSEEEEEEERRRTLLVSPFLIYNRTWKILRYFSVGRY